MTSNQSAQTWEVRHPHKPLIWIAFYKFLKVAFTLTGGIAAMHLVHHDLPQLVHHLLNRLNIAPESHIAAWLIARALHLDDRRLRLISAGFFLYSTLYTIEGVGLYLEQRWAEWLTIITSFLLVPVEVYHMVYHPSWLKLLIIVLNLGIIAYLLYLIAHPPEEAVARLRFDPARHPAPEPLR